MLSNFVLMNWMATYPQRRGEDPSPPPGHSRGTRISASGHSTEKLESFCCARSQLSTKNLYPHKSPLMHESTKMTRDNPQMIL